MNHLLTLLAAICGFVPLCLSMHRHQEALLGRLLSPGQNRTLRLVGYLLLATAYGIAVQGFGWGVGSVAWTGHLAAAATVVMLGLVWQNRHAQG